MTIDKAVLLKEVHHLLGCPSGMMVVRSIDTALGSHLLSAQTEYPRSDQIKSRTHLVLNHLSSISGACRVPAKLGNDESSTRLQ